MKWDYKNLNVFLDVSTYCNAGCPQCHRTNPDGLGKAEWLPLIQWDLKTFQKAFPVSEMQNILEFKFCGTWGDPVMCKELYEMIEYIITMSDARVVIHTNGSIRDEEWWWDLGILCGKRLKVFFTIDGIDQQMHEKYRRFTSLEKTLNNMKMLSQTKSRVESQTIVFKHNQDYQEEIRTLVKEYGSEVHTFILSDRFDYESGVVNNKRYFIDENGNEDYLEKADRESLPTATVTGRNIRELEEKIVCRWAMPRNEIVVNPDGQILPCCYHANAHYTAKTDKNYFTELMRNPIYSEDYNNNLEKYNILYTPLSEIIRSEWYTKILPGSIKGDNPVRQCLYQCSSKIKKQHQIRVIDVT